MHSIADKKWNNDKVFFGGEGIAVCDARLFFHENGMNFGVDVFGPNQFDLTFDCFSRVIVCSCAVTSNEKRCFAGFRRTREREFFDNIFSARQKDVGHAIVGANGTAVIERLRAAILNALKIRLPFSSEPEFNRDCLFTKISFADQKWDDKYATGRNRIHDGRDEGLLFPKRGFDARKNVTSPQFGGVLYGGRSGILVHT